MVGAEQAFRAYLFGTEFLLRTYHKALLWRTKPEGRLWRWVYELSEYAFSVEHYPGKENLVADALSRVDAVCIEPEWSMEEIVVEQEDPELLTLRRELQKTKTKLDLFAPAEGLLSIHPTIDAILYATRNVLPKSLRNTALELMHDHGGHMGMENRSRT